MGRTPKILIFFLTGLIVAAGGAVFWWNVQFKQPGSLKTETIVIIERGVGAGRGFFPIRWCFASASA